MEPKPITRRAWLWKGLRLCGAAGALALGASGCASGAVSVRPGPDRRLTVRVEEYPELAAPGGSVKLRTEDTGKLVYLVHTPEGNFVALDPTCTHAACKVRPEPGMFECPCHGSRFDLRGNVLRGPAVLPLTSYPTLELSPGLVEIALP